MIIELINLTKLKKSVYLLTLNADGKTTDHKLVFDDSFVPRIAEVDDVLRPILVNNPRAAQQIIQMIEKKANNIKLRLPFRLSVWEEETIPEKIAA